MKLNTGQRAALLIQARMGTIPDRGTIAYERWLCAQNAGRIYISHVWDCPVCNPEGLPPERLKTLPCHRADLFYTEAMVYRSALQAEVSSDNRAKIHKKWTPKGGPNVFASGHLAPLIRA